MTTDRVRIGEITHARSASGILDRWISRWTACGIRYLAEGEPIEAPVDCMSCLAAETRP